MISRELVMSKFARDDRFAVNLLLALYARQTADEQLAQATGHDNGVGFNGTDANILSSFAEQVIRNRRMRSAGGSTYSSDLSPKQMTLLRTKMVKYGKQLTDLTNAQMTVKAERLPVEIGNDDHIVLAEEYAASQSDRSPSPWGNECPPTQYHPLPDHLQRTRNEVVVITEEVDLSDAPFLLGTGPGALVACEGGFRFKTAKEQWTDGGKRDFNAVVTKWCEERQSGQLVRCGGGPGDGVADDPFHFGA